MRIRFVHAADLHLDSPFTGLKTAAPENVANRLYTATFDAYENIVNLCISEEVDALLVAGDVYDGADRSLRAQLKFVEGLNRLDAKGIRSFVCHGNHDPLDGWHARLNYPPSCHRFGPDFEVVPVFSDDPDRAVIHGISYPKREVTENLARRLGQGRSRSVLDWAASRKRQQQCGTRCLWPVLARRLGAIGRPLLGAGPRAHPPGAEREGAGGCLSRQPAGTAPERDWAPGRVSGRSGRRGKRWTPTSGPWTPSAGLGLIRISERSRRNRNSWTHCTNGCRVCWTGPMAGRSSFAIRLTGRGELNQPLRRPNTIEDLVEEINREWAEQSPFAWCERIEDASASPFDREAQAEGIRFSGGGAADGGSGEDRCGAPDKAWNRAFRPLPASPLSTVFV